MKTLSLLALPLLALPLATGCASAWIKERCDGTVKRAPRDCEQYYQTTVKTRMVDVGGELGTLAGVTVGGNFAISEEVTNLAQQYDQLNSQLMKSYIARCSTWAMDVCAVDMAAEQDWIDQVNDRFLAARTALATAEATARGGRAGDEEVEQALETQVDTAASALAEVQGLLEPGQ